MNDHKFNVYLRRYQDSYKGLKRELDGVWKIQGKLGEIAPYAPENELLGVWCMTPGLSKRKSSALKAKLAPVVQEFHQEGDIEFAAIFDEKDLAKVAKIIGAHKKPQYSPETLAAKRKAMLEIRHNSEKSQNGQGFQP